MQQTETDGEGQRQTERPSRFRPPPTYPPLFLCLLLSLTPFSLLTLSTESKKTLGSGLGFS